MSTSRKRIEVLTLAERINEIKRSEKGGKSIAIATSLGIGKTQIQSIILDKENLKERWEKGEDAGRKTVKRMKCMFGDLNDRVFDWFCEAREKNVPLTGALIQEKALLLSVQMNHDSFTASNGWLQKWLLRYNIRSCTLSGERAEIDSDVVDSWLQRLPSLCEGYDPKDVFNADETGFCFRALPKKSMVVKGEETGRTSSASIIRPLHYKTRFFCILRSLIMEGTLYMNHR